MNVMAEVLAGILDKRHMTLLPTVMKKLSELKSLNTKLDVLDHKFNMVSVEKNNVAADDEVKFIKM